MKKILVATMMLLAGIAFAAPPDFTPPGHQNDGGDSHAQASANSNSQAIGVGIGVGGDGGRASAHAVGNGGEGGNAVAKTGSSSSTSNIATDTDVNVITDNPKPAASGAAAVFPQTCQEGASGQSYSGGASSVFESSMCQSLRMAEVHQGYWKMYTEMGDLNQAAMHKQLMDRYVAEASDSADITYWPKTVGSTFLSILPVGLLFLL